MKTRLRDHLTLGGKIRYGLWRLLSQRHRLSVRLAGGDRLLIRPPPATDLQTVHEIFVGRHYAPPTPLRREKFRFIADLGANVGYSLLYWLRELPMAQAIAFEPHPRHISQIADLLRLNGLKGRVDLHAAAAGTADGSAHFTDAENQSAIVATGGSATVEVAVEDWLRTIADRTIDLLKMDIEGSEYALLGDERFARQPVRVLVMEWHNTKSVPDGRGWCMRRLEELSFRAEPTFDYGSHGIIWAFHRSLSEGYVAPEATQ